MMKPASKIALCSIVAAAALYAAETQAKKFTPTQLRWWAFQPVVKPAIPAVRNTTWAKTPIDAFVAAKLEEKELIPNPAADKATLLRRAYLDLTGIPPSPEQTQAFLADNSPKAFENVIDSLLASPRYGERWARHWLDLARYADSEGFKSDETRPNIWRYRDYVIKSLNADKPYDKFVREQIAGDELYPENPEAKIAVAFNRHFPDESNARNLLQRRQEFLNDITDTVASTFLGLTYGCAKCHDHKFDPILHKDYYRLQAFFANTRIEDRAVLLDKSAEADWKVRNANWEGQTKAVRDEMHALAGPVAERQNKDDFDKFPEEIQDAITVAPEKRTPIQWHMYYKAKPYMSHSEEAAAKTLKGAQATRYKELKTALTKFDAIKPPELPVAQTMIDLDGGASPKTHVLAVGVYDAYREEVQPGFLSILDPTDAKITPPAGVASSGRRSALANWLADAKNPLSTRVIVNRVWHYHFGKGISGTPSDFGVMGERPANKELLDYLTSEFIDKGWSLKKLHKTILMSATWQQSSGYNEASAKIDPDNKYMWRFSRRRLEGETIRDSMLSVSGRLNTKMFGPGVYPPMPAGVETRGGWKKDESQEEADRRSVYVFVRRNTRYPMFEAFDMPDTHESCARRNNTVTPSQSLELLNSNLVVDWAKSLAERVTNDTGLTKETQIDRAYRMAYSRMPNADERKSAVDFLNRQASVAGGEKAAFVDFCHMLLNSNEFVYMN